MNTDSPELERMDWRFRPVGDKTRCPSSPARRYRIMDVRFEVREVRRVVRACDSSEATRLKIMFCLDWPRDPLDSEGAPGE